MLINHILAMTEIENRLLWEKWRPKKIEDIILLPRIKNLISGGITDNYIFYGNYGIGKTSLARILIGKYKKNIPYIEINSSLYTSIDVLRNEIEDFCKFKPILDVDSDIKYVFLDEFDRVSTQFQDAFKAFIEKYNSNVRFIITTNHISKISNGIKSRITQVNFDPQSLEEEKFLKTEIYKKIKNDILKSENIDIPKDNLVKIINKKYPDIRSIIVEISNYSRTGNIDENLLNSNKLKNDLYDILYNKSVGYEDIYHFVLNNFGSDKINELIEFLGKPFVDWSILNNKNIDKLFECNFIISDYSFRLENSLDPVVLGITIIGKLRNVLLNN